MPEHHEVDHALALGVPLGDHYGNVGVCVLTPDGTTLQIYDPQWGRCTNVCIFERKLLLCGHGYEGEQAASSSRASPASSILEGELVEVLCGL